MIAGMAAPRSPAGMETRWSPGRGGGAHGADGAAAQGPRGRAGGGGGGGGRRGGGGGGGARGGGGGGAPPPPPPPRGGRPRGPRPPRGGPATPGWRHAASRSLRLPRGPPRHPAQGQRAQPEGHR